MPAYATDDIRNIALVGHAGSGKTTLAESMLFTTGIIQTMGSVEKGNTTCDFDRFEQQHHHSFNPAIIGIDYQGKHLNIIDTPGYPDFMGQTLSVLPAVETMAIVINAETGIEMMTRRMMDWAEEHGLCRIIVVNKIDTDDSDLEKLMADINDAFGKECIAINLPDSGNSGVVDCFFNQNGDVAFSSVSDTHTALIDQVVEVDDQLMELYLEQGDIQPEQLHDAFETALREGHLIPVCFVSARNGVGIQELLDIFTKLMPNPHEANPHRFLDGNGAGVHKIMVQPESGQHALAHVFKVSHDPFVGKLGIFRIHQGTITKDSQLFIGDQRKAFKVGHLYRLLGKEHIETDACIPGDICAVVKVNNIHFGAVLHDSHDEDNMHAEPDGLPIPMVGLAIETKSRGEEQKISDVLEKLSSEDPCLTVERNAVANETVLRGLGDLHLRVALEKIRDQFHIDVDTHPPTIAYREAITRPADGHHRHKKQTGGAGQFGEVFLKIRPLERGAGFRFINDISGGVIPGQYISAVEKGVRHAIEAGVISGFPLQDIEVSVYDGKHHAVDSNEVSFSTAARKAFIDAVLKAKPIVLEPIVNMLVTVPASTMGDVTGDLSSRRGRISSSDARGNGMLEVSAQVPVAELTDYQSRLKSITAGEGVYSMEFSHYEAAPPNVQQQLVKKYQSKEQD